MAGTSFFSKDSLEAKNVALNLIFKIVIIIIILWATIFTPHFIGKIQNVLKTSGLELSELELFGAKLKFSEQLKSSQQILQESRAQIEQLTQGNEDLTNYVRCLHQGSCTEAQSKSISSITGGSSAINSVLSSTDSVKTSIDQAIRESESLIEQTKLALSTSAAGEWVVVAGSDLTLESAKDEENKLVKRYPAEAEIIVRGKWFVTIVRFPSEQDARAAVQEVAAITGREPFVRSFAEWCPDPKVGIEGVLECSASK